jgi:hypothetical protein
MIQPGDLVQLRDWVGLVVAVDHSIGGHDPLYKIAWNDGTSGQCWEEELSIVSACALQPE